MSRKYNILVTSGGTYEKIDDVRLIRNNSTGKLGSMISDEFIKNGHNVTYVTSKYSILPFFHCNDIIFVNSAYNLYTRIEALLNNNQFDFIIHSMAVSDYRPCIAFNLDSIFDYFNSNDKVDKQSFINFLNDKNLMHQPKISSNFDDMFIYLKSTKKVINLFKKMQPKATLVAFKLLVNSCQEKMIDISLDLMYKNKCDYVLVNDLNYINENEHKALFISKNKDIYHLNNKLEISKKIVQTLLDEGN